MINLDPEEIARLEQDHDATTRKEYAPSPRQKIGWFTVACFILNRSIGSGIFVTPLSVLRATQSVGISLIFWIIGGFVVVCGSLIWIEFGLSTPRHDVEETGHPQAVPRSGGEKNYLEWVMRKPRFLVTCQFGILYIILGNLSGNAIALGRYVLLAAGHEDPQQKPVIGIAVGVLSAVVLLHVFSRSGGLVLSNAFALLKVAILAIIIILGFAVRGGANFNHNRFPSPKGSNFSPKTTFDVSNVESGAGGVANYTQAFLLVLYTYSGFEQPFYVLSEVHRPKKYFAKSVLGALAVLTSLFLLTNVAYLCVVPMSVIMDPANAKTDLASLFFHHLFGNNAAQRVMQGAIALCILGNLVVMTFTAARVKQEIAKEGILPWSLPLASGKTTPTAWLLERWRKQKHNPELDSHGDPVDPLEQTPMAALFLHWLSSLFLLGITSMIKKPLDQYTFLVSLYSYVIVVLLGVATSLALLYAKYVRHDWVSEFKPWGGPTSAIIFFIAYTFCLVTAFLTPSGITHTGYPSVLVPAIGISAPLWGTLWWLGLKLVMRQRGQVLRVVREPFCVQEREDGEWVMKYEVLHQIWEVSDGDSHLGGGDGEEDAFAAGGRWGGNEAPGWGGEGLRGREAEKTQGNVNGGYLP
ncbi:amino acid transporter [Trichodelitschia bisporula]|uniref:Amino acid transporter n=1 Tax=Trichodelitschia bisporula TaxID=703511 RepID=A0A6G1I0N3_9PEZI|nr:amino acid transporter [Trichodelitschia bisporula]